MDVIHLPFERFNFGDGYTWGLAFYKLCAQYYVSHETEYEQFLCLDSDVYVQDSLKEVWADAQTQLVGCGATGDAAYAEEVARFTGAEGPHIRYGGEFLAAPRELLRALTERENAIFQEMERMRFRTEAGDEFILSLALREGNFPMKLANDQYVSRFWTGAFRRVFPGYARVPILHVPAEKWNGMIAIFDRYVSQGMLPERETVYRLLHLDHRSPKETLKYYVKKLLRRA